MPLKHGIISESHMTHTGDILTEGGGIYQPVAAEAGQGAAEQRAPTERGGGGAKMSFCHSKKCSR